jgi:UDP-N-acetylmuramate dehydrogenase
MTNLTRFFEDIKRRLPALELRLSEPMSLHTSFRIGGPAEAMAFPQNEQELGELLALANTYGIEPRILGAGTNVLAPDEGIPGLVICLKDCLNGMELLDENSLRVYGGVTMTRAAVFAANHGLAGLEFAHGIPGTVGGGVYMNAGAYGGEICMVCKSVDVMSMDGSMRTLDAAQMHFSYRYSRLEEEGGIVVSAVFSLKTDDPDAIRGRMQELAGKRKASQPLDLPSAGSAFKRPVGGYAAALIDQAGLRGYQIGGAAVSEKHAGFVVNIDKATADDVRRLLSSVSDIVFEKSGIRLEPEVRIW